MRTLSIWTLFWSPGDAPGMFVLRRFEVQGTGPHATLDALYSRHAEPLREHMRKLGLHMVPRSQGDNPSVVESWL